MATVHQTYTKLGRELPRIATLFDRSTDAPGHILYENVIWGILRKMLPNAPLFEEESEVDALQELHKELPLVTWEWWGRSSKFLSVFLLCPYQIDARKFFYEMITRWLVPGKRLDVGSFFSTDFHFPETDGELYTIAEIVLRLQEESQREVVARNLPILETEIRLGVASIYHASRILEIKGLSADEKTTLIQERIAALLQKRPSDFDPDIFGQMQHFLVTCREEFKAIREWRHMSRMICIFYLLRKMLRSHMEESSEQRRLFVKLLKTRLQLPFGVKPVLGVFVSMNLLKENEVFEERHLLKALRHQIADVEAVRGSFFFQRAREEQVQTIYLEVEKRDGSGFSTTEIRKLRRTLPEDLKSYVEFLVRPTFMPRNEEEVMRNIVTLSEQLKFPKDLPQVIISFDEQSGSDLLFTLILLRVLHPHTLSTKDLLAHAKAPIVFTLERIKRVGVIRKKYLKEAAVFRAKMCSRDFLRDDHSVDLLGARQHLLGEVQRLVGEVRDFNGGMIAKQQELFLSLKARVGELSRSDERLLESFFHSIFPIEHRSVLGPIALKTLFFLLKDLIGRPKGIRSSSEYVIQRGEAHLFLAVATKDAGFKQRTLETIEKLHLHSSELATVQMQLGEISYLGILLVYHVLDRAGSLLDFFLREGISRLDGNE